jgi:HlyD family secretion protein
MQKAIIISILAFVLFYLGCGQHELGRVTGSGTMEAKEILLSAKIAGSLTALSVREGEAVRAGQVLADIDSEKVFLQKQQLLAGLQELRLNLISVGRGVALAKDNLDNVEKKYQRIKALLADGSATQQQFDDTETAFKAMQTQYENACTALETLKVKETQILIQVELLASQLRDCRVVSPIDGTVTETFVEVGEIARPGGAVINLADLQHLWIKIYVKEADLARIALDGAAELRITADPKKVFPGRVAWISPKAEFTPKNVQTKEARSDLVYAVKITVDNPEGVLKIGMPADVTIL